MKNLTFTDLIDVKSLQMIQDSFASYTKLAISVIDTDGKYVTKASGKSDFCDYLRAESKEGLERCLACDRDRIEKVLASGESVFYRCHTGMTDFSVPVKFMGRIIGIIHAGKVRTDALDEAEVRKTAEELSLPVDKFSELANNTTYLDKAEVERTAQFLSEFSNALSVLAYENYAKLDKSRKMESAARSQASYITNMTEELRTSMKGWIDFFMEKTDKYKDMPEVTAETDVILKKGQEVYSVIDGVVDYIHLSGGNVEYSETIYDVRELASQAVESVRKEAASLNVTVDAIFDDSLPKSLMGNSGRIGQLMSQIMIGAARKTKNGGSIETSVFCEDKSYSCILNIKILCRGTTVDLKTEKSVKKMMKGTASDAFKGGEAKGTKDAGLPSIVFLVKQMAGSIDFESLGDDGVLISLSIPQLKCDVSTEG